MWRIGLAVVLSLGPLCPADASTTWFVDDDAPNDPGPGDPLVSDPLEDGSSDHPFDAIQQALDVASDGDEIVLVSGTYTGPGNRDLQFGGKGVTLRSSAGPETCIVDLQQVGHASTFRDGETPACTLDGIQFVNGIGNNGTGGGIFRILAASPTIQNCILRDSQASQGGAVFLLNSAAEFRDCLFQRNTADHRGGAIHADGGAPTMVGCNLDDNYADNAGAAHLSGQAQMIDCVVIGNAARLQTGGVEVTDDAVVRNCEVRGNDAEGLGFGGGLTLADNALVEDTLIAENSATRGGGVLFLDGVLRRCRIIGNTAIRGGGIVHRGSETSRAENCLIQGNAATNGGGGGVQKEDSSLGHLRLVHCTIVQNTSNQRGAGVFADRGRLTLLNTIAWANEAGISGDQAAVGANGDLRVESSNVRGGPTVIWVNIGGDLVWDEYSIAAGPRFLDLGNGDLRIADDSPCANAGSPAAVSGLIDLAGEPRIRQCQPDMGAYESDGFIDCDGSGFSDACELEDGSRSDCNDNRRLDRCDVDLSDLDGDGEVLPDCNRNGIPDSCEPDCNTNGIPDDCDTDSSDPDGSGDSVPDCNDDGIPDSCQLDCNDNGIPDDCDTDPSDPDGSGDSVPDCNQNGIPDSCESDCNGNGIPDDCDIDPSDPDLDENVIADCDNNGVPDDCQEDCDQNGVLDACDVDPNDPDGDGLVADDCDGNGIPDTCDLGTTRKQVIEGEDQRGVLDVKGDLAAVTYPTEQRVDLYRLIDGVWTFEWTLEEEAFGFGDNVAVDGDRVAVIASFTEFPNAVRLGVWTYHRTESGWELESLLRPRLPSSGRKGGEIALDGDTLVLGPRFLDIGDAIFYRLEQDTWIEEARFEASTRQITGEPVKIQLQRDMVLVGNPNYNGERGVVDVYRKIDGHWLLAQRLMHPTPEAGDFFGAGLALEGSHLLVGVPGEGNIGTAFPYVFDGFRWQVGTRIRPPRDGAEEFDFGQVLTISEDEAFFRARERLLRFRRTGNDWAYVDFEEPGATHMQLNGAILVTRRLDVISALTFIEDCDDDGVLDGCEPEPDRNANGRPDSCDQDCNGNGIPDLLDVDPSDPDGDGRVALDCDGNLVPDECDLDPSDPDGNGYVVEDCNQNGLPDACEPDCNRNGLADSCDLDAGADSDNDGRIDSCYRRGDVNGDGFVETGDLAILLGEYGCEESCLADVSGDGRTDISDLAVVLRNFGS